MGRPGAMTQRVLRLLTQARSRQVWFTIDRIHDLDPAALVAAGVRGVLLDADGTLVPHRARVYPPEVYETLRRLLDGGLRVAVYSNADDPQALRPLGVPVVTGVPLKPARAGFQAAIRQGLDMLEPGAVAMVGDNLISDGGAVDAGLRFIYCRPIPGREPWLHWTARAWAERWVGAAG
ncbi:MAG: hypothetical protein H6702_17805 [Myxococcales bacterium]|nr:hypothetical protein [Myxococcales bacterium]